MTTQLMPIFIKNKEQEGVVTLWGLCGDQVRIILRSPGVIFTVLFGLGVDTYWFYSWHPIIIGPPAPGVEFDLSSHY